MNCVGLVYILHVLPIFYRYNFLLVTLIRRLNLTREAAKELSLYIHV